MKITPAMIWGGYAVLGAVIVTLSILLWLEHRKATIYNDGINDIAYGMYHTPMRSHR